MNISRNMLLAALVISAPFALAGEQPATGTTATTTQATVTAPATDAKKDVTADDSKKDVAKAGIIATAIALPGSCVDFVANWGGAARVAKWLATPKKDTEAGSIVSFFATNEKLVRRSLALVETAVIVAAAYKAYQTFFAEEDDMDGDEYDAEFADVFDPADEENN